MRCSFNGVHRLKNNRAISEINVSIIILELGKCREIDGAGWVDYVLWSNTSSAYDAGHWTTISKGFHITSAKRGKYMFVYIIEF